MCIFYDWGDSRMHTIPKDIDKSEMYKVNLDYNGEREMSDFLETIKYRNNSAMRIWYNDISESYDMHWHNTLEIIVPIENYYDVTINKELYHVNPDEILMIPPRSLHSIQAPENGARFVYLFDISFLSRLNGYHSIMSLLNHPVYITRNNSPELYDEVYLHFTNMKNDYFINQEYCDFLIYSSLLRLFATLGRHHIQQLDISESSFAGKKQEYVNKFLNVVEYIDMHYSEDLSLEKISAACGFSKFHFSRLFKQYTGFTFCDYLNYRRISHAEDLLTNHDCLITEIALQSGFSSISTFNRLFKQLKGCSPTEYRAKSSHAL